MPNVVSATTFGRAPRPTVLGAPAAACRDPARPEREGGGRVAGSSGVAGSSSTVIGALAVVCRNSARPESEGGAATTATALAADPADCSATQFATAIAAAGTLSCAAITDADVPNSITVTLAATATALAANPSPCTAGDFVTDIAADGTLTCDTPAGGSGLTHPQIMARLAVGGGY